MTHLFHYSQMETMTRNVLQLPYEILDYILEFVTTDDLPTMVSASFVCRKFLEGIHRTVDVDELKDSFYSEGILCAEAALHGYLNILQHQNIHSSLHWNTLLDSKDTHSLLPTSTRPDAH